MNRKAQFSPTNEELREWGYNLKSQAPLQDWELILSWNMDRGRLRICVEMASDQCCPQSKFFLFVLYQWVETAAKDPQFESRRSTHVEWGNDLRGISDASVKRWRYHARRSLQSAESFDLESWRQTMAQETRSAES